MPNSTAAAPAAPSPSHAANSTAGASSAQSALQALRNRQNQEYPETLWYIILGVLAFLTLVNIAVKGARTLRKYRALHHALEHPETSLRLRPPNPHGPVAVRRLPLAAVNAGRVAFFRWTLPFTNATLADALFTLGYTFLMLLWSFVASRGANISIWASRTGAIATSQMALLPVLSSKNNIISFLTGIPHEKMIFLHRAAGRNMVLLLWLHGAGKYSTGVRFTTLPMTLGGVALGALTLLFLLSLRGIRTQVYEFFLVSHIILVATLMVCGWYHVEKFHKTGYWVYAGMILWAFDRVFRLFRVIFTTRAWSSQGSSEATIELVSDDTIRVRMQRPMSWHAGQHAFLTFPGVSNWSLEAHPFTIATIPDPPTREATSMSGAREVQFIIRGREGFTGRLRDAARQAQRDGRSTVTAFVDGPYGMPPDLTTYSTSILIAGGSGVSYTIAMFENLIQQARKKTSVVQRVVFVWTIRDEAHIAWIYEQLYSALSCVPQNLSVSVRIFVSRAPGLINGLPYDGGLSRSQSNATVVDKYGYKEKSSVEDLYAFPNVRIEGGRPDVYGIIATEVSMAQGAVSIDVSGPSPLIASVRAATRASEIAGSGGVARGMPSISLHAEEFSM